MTAPTLRYVVDPGCEPLYATPGAAGLDLRAAVDDWVASGNTRAIRTGLRVEIPDGYVGFVRGRSGLAFKYGVFLHDGTVDQDYRGEIQVLLHNVTCWGGFHVSRGDRIAQLVIVPVARCTLEPVAELTATARGAGGFGSSGVR